MPLLLNIETATSTCSVSLSLNNSILGIKESNELNSHAAVLTVFIEQLLSENGVKGSSLDAVCISRGPGSYTGLRIGTAVAKGLCYGWEKPLLAVNTLQAMTSWFLEKGNYPKSTTNGKLLFCPMIDARRMEVYCALFNSNLEFIDPTQALIIDEHSFEKFFSSHTICFFGNGAAKCKAVLGLQPNAVFIDGFEPSAAGMTRLAEMEFNAKNLQDPAYFEPFYLKDFVATTPRSQLKNTPRE